MEMAELVVKVPEKLKEKMSKIDWVNWSSVAIKAISERLEDIIHRYIQETNSDNDLPYIEISEDYRFFKICKKDWI